MNKHAIGYGYRPTSTVEQFCDDNNISRTLLFQLWKDGKGPRRMKVGRRTLITAEAGAEWRAQMEKETAEAAQ